MRIDHVAMYVMELERSRDFYERFFNAVANEKYCNPQTGLETYFLSFEDGARLELMHRPEQQPQDSEYAQGLTHLAFCVGSKAAVDELSERLRAAGYTVAREPRTMETELK